MAKVGNWRRRERWRKRMKRRMSAGEGLEDVKKDKEERERGRLWAVTKMGGVDVKMEENEEGEENWEEDG